MQSEAVKKVQEQHFKVKGLANGDCQILKSKWTIAEAGLSSGESLVIELREETRELLDAQKSNGDNISGCFPMRQKFHHRLSQFFSCLCSLVP